LCQVSLRFGKTAIVPVCQIEHRPGSFRDSLLFRWQLSGVARRGTKVEEALVRVFGEGRVIVNSRSVNRRKIRSEWFEFLSRETNGRRDSGILMRHAIEYQGGESRLFSLFPSLSLSVTLAHITPAESCMANMGSQ